MSDRSLGGIRALVTRPVAQGAALVAAIRAAGGEATALPLIEIRALDERDAALQASNERILSTLDGFDCAIFISTNAVRHFLSALAARGITPPPRLRCFAIGSATGARLREAGIDATGATDAMNSEELLAHPELLAANGKRVLIVKGVGGRDHLAETLAQRGARVSECALYHRAAPALTRAEFDAVLRAQCINTVLLSSGDALTNLLRLQGSEAAGTMHPDIVWVVGSRRLAALANDAGLPRIVTARNATDAAMIDALQRILDGSATAP